jgi:hypothetical protein
MVLSALSVSPVTVVVFILNLKPRESISELFSLDFEVEVNVQNDQHEPVGGSRFTDALDLRDQGRAVAVLSDGALIGTGSVQAGPKPKIHSPPIYS